MGTRTEYFCDFCEHTFPYPVLVPFHVSAGDLVVSPYAAEGEKHVCQTCINVIAAARVTPPVAETLLDERPV